MVDHPLAERAMTAGRRAFGPRWQPGRVATAPGRIELLGNHLDYNGGPVLAAAIDRSISVFTGSDDSGLRGLVADVAGARVETFDPAALAGWRNAGAPESYDYVRGAVASIQSRVDMALREDLDFVIAGDVPMGFGLSSSAALCVSLILSLTEHQPSERDLVLAAQEAEHRAGTPCGTMDQSASVAGGMICFDGSTLAVEKLSPDLGAYVFAVADSGVERSLGSSAYGRRVEESALALRHISSLLGREMTHLADLTGEQLSAVSERLDQLEPVLLKRARHVVSETVRVRQGKQAADRNDWPAFGRLMTSSGRSSAIDYEISHPRVEELVSEACRVPGVLGARMMGGGEGGTALTLLRRDSVDALNQSLRRGYYRRYDMSSRDDLIHVCAFSKGAHAMSISRGVSPTPSM